MTPPRTAKQRAFRFAFGAATLGLTVAVVASSAGRLHWAFDLATHFRAQYAAVGLVLAGGYAIAGRFRAAVLPFVLGSVNLWFTAPFYVAHEQPNPPPAAAARLKIISLNVFAGSQAYDEVVDYIRAARPDIVLFMELTPAWRVGLKPLEDEYPEQHFLSRNSPFDLGLIAKPALREVRFEPLGVMNPHVRATFDIDGRTVTLFGVHPPPPMGERMSTIRNQAFTALQGLVREVEGPVIVAGDFNSTSWSPYFADLLEATRLLDSRLGRGLQPSWSMQHVTPLHIPIDHMLVSPEVQIFERRVGPKVGSDHLPVEMEFGLRQ